jgi:hypothetical protein
MLLVDGAERASKKSGGTGGGPAGARKLKIPGESSVSRDFGSFCSGGRI